MVRWILSTHLTSTFFPFLVTCQDNVNQSGNVGHVHYAVGVDVASSVCVSCSAENLVDKSSNVRYVNHAVGVDVALSAWFFTTTYVLTNLLNCHTVVALEVEESNNVLSVVVFHVEAVYTGTTVRSLTEAVGRNLPVLSHTTE